MLDHEPVRVAPVVEDLAALDVPADAPRVLVAVLAQVLPAGGQRVEVGDLVGGVHVAVAGPSVIASVWWSVGVAPRSQRMKLITGPRSRCPG